MINFSRFLAQNFRDVDVVVGENVLHIYNYSLICGNAICNMQIHETPVRGVQGVSKTTAPLLHLKLKKTHYQM